MLITELVCIVKLLVDFLLTGLGILAYYSGLTRFIIGTRPHSPRVLMYHACEEYENDFIRGLSINTTPAHFVAQIEFLKKYYQIVPLELLGSDDQPDCAVVITFDDGFRSVFEHALPVLRSYNLPATCYLVTDQVVNPSAIWINELNWFLHRYPKITKELVARRLGIRKSLSRSLFFREIVARYNSEKIVAILTELRSLLAPIRGSLGPTDRMFVSRREIDEMARDVFTFGNHTGSHAVLSNLSDEDCREEIHRARTVLSCFPGVIQSLAYPFGQFDERVHRIARELGYTTLMEVEGDNNPLDLVHIGRVNVDSVTPAVLFARMEVVARIKSRMKRFLKGIRRRIRK